MGVCVCDADDVERRYSGYGKRQDADGFRVLQRGGVLMRLRATSSMAHHQHHHPHINNNHINQTYNNTS